MKSRTPALTALSLAIAMAIALPLPAQERAPKAPTAAEQKQLDAARKELDAAAKKYAELAAEYGTRQHLLRKPVIGVVLAPDAKVGVRIVGVTPGSAAEDSGLRSGDRIVAIDNKAIGAKDAAERVEDARKAIAAHDEKSKVRIRYVRDGREATIAVAPKAGERMIFIPGMEPMDHDVEFRRNFKAHQLPDGKMKVEGEDVHFLPPIAPDVRREIIRLRSDGKFPVMAEAMRWNGLNLAAVDATLGKYFGTDKGVLVLSTGPELDGLESGDVIRSIAGKEVDSPREVMESLRGRKTGSKVDVGYLRDRKTGTALVTVPEPMRFHIPAPPAPPAPPAAPKAPTPPVPPAPPAPPRVD